MRALAEAAKAAVRLNATPPQGIAHHTTARDVGEETGRGHGHGRDQDMSLRNLTKR